MNPGAKREQRGDATTIELPAVLGSARRARDVARSFALRHGADADDVALAVSEAVTNVIVHAYPDPDGGRIELGFRRERDELLVEIADRGVGIGSAAGASRGFGAGLALIGLIASSVEVGPRRGGGTRLRLSFRLG